MRGYLPSQSDDSKQPPRTSLLVRWLPSDHVLLDALRPFKARARGRRFKELATLGAELERRGFRLEASGEGYRLMLPVEMAAGLEIKTAALVSLDQARLIDTAPLPPASAASGLAVQDAALELPVHTAIAEHQTGPVTPLVDDDTLEFAASFG
ncbi:hypothetical protein VWT76_15675 [Xanthomonas citri pv. citri]|uniref:hypothetical protein n=1 Tax=Xanthomonas citri TaxID=346 RepID=UPI0009522311|nr:hypothetical protein [Xanthomonas citri]MBD5034936.1 hypothetical protein [Xanthomonas citri pv. citri]MBD5054780.1 hypothetical protein [Xanthomonas citri pv. citri]OLR69846.1 hypothetical protein BI311_24370 [Xanthomonas citri pv. citri]